jgi:hypothetical protein
MLQKHYYHPELRKEEEVTLPSGNKWVQKYKSERIFAKRKRRIFEFII